MVKKINRPTTHPYYNFVIQIGEIILIGKIILFLIVKLTKKDI